MTARSTTTRDRHRNAIRREHPPCGICHQPIDYTLPHTHPKSYVVDHVIPLSISHDDSLANKQAAHRDCNRTKSNKTAEEMAPRVRTYQTHRQWVRPRPAPPDATRRGGG